MDPSGIPVAWSLEVRVWQGNLYERLRMWWTNDVMHPLFCEPSGGCYGHGTWGEWVPE